MQEGRVRPAATYPQNSPEKLSKQLFGRYHIIAPLPKEGPLQIQRLEASAPINPNLSSNCHYMSPTLTPLGQPDSNYTSPQSASRHSVFFREKRHLRSPKNTILPFHPSVRERHTWSRVSRRMNMTVGTVKRSVSTPNVQQAASLSAASGGGGFTTDKRRNKLGYHRTSVACGHCRRRKIRCLLAKEDNQGRCSNCIRLKKECNFFPVESADRRPRSLSKPDISTNEASSSASSPSPGLALGKLPRSDASSIYAVSVPVTPTFDYHSGILDDTLRHNSISSATSGRLSISHSTATSRRPSLAFIPGFKTDHDYIHNSSIESPNFTRMSSCRMGSLPEMPSGPADHTGLDSAFWRLTSSPMTPSQYPVYSQQVSLGSIPSLHPATSPDAPDDSIWPHRLNSIDQELAPGVIYPQFSADVDYNRSVSELYSTSASASTASLVASVTDVSNQSYLAPWVNASSAGVNIHSNAVMKIETFDGYYPPDAKYQELTDETSSMFPSPLQSPKFVS